MRKSNLLFVFIFLLVGNIEGQTLKNVTDVLFTDEVNGKQSMFTGLELELSIAFCDTNKVLSKSFLFFGKEQLYIKIKIKNLSGKELWIPDFKFEKGEPSEPYFVFFATNCKDTTIQYLNNFNDGRKYRLYDFYLLKPNEEYSKTVNLLAYYDLKLKDGCTYTIKSGYAGKIFSFKNKEMKDVEVFSKEINGNQLLFKY